jgi:hypothetical protein
LVALECLRLGTLGLVVVTGVVVLVLDELPLWVPVLVDPV